jgi:hypothetical protein
MLNDCEWRTCAQESSLFRSRDFGDVEKQLAENTAASTHGYSRCEVQHRASLVKRTRS